MYAFSLSQKLIFSFSERDEKHQEEKKSADAFTLFNSLPEYHIYKKREQVP